MTTFQIGRQAETCAAEYLQSIGFRVLHQNWHTRYCEIDIVAGKDKTIYFVEVKYRKRPDYGNGLDYITPKKLTQMQLAAQFWISNHDWDGDYRLAAVEVCGPDYNVTNFLDEL